MAVQNEERGKRGGAERGCHHDVRLLGRGEVREV